MRSDDITHVISGTDVSLPTATWQAISGLPGDVLWNIALV